MFLKQQIDTEKNITNINQNTNKKTKFLLCSRFYPPSIP